MGKNKAELSCRDEGHRLTHFQNVGEGKGENQITSLCREKNIAN